MVISERSRLSRRAKPKILVVDDEPDNLDLLYRTFYREYQVLRAQNGAQALSTLAEQSSITVIISDQRMPGMSGTELLRQTAVLYPNIIRIILTGYTDVEDLVEAINAGQVFKYVTKPWDEDNLKGVVRQALDTHNVLKARTEDLDRILRQESLLNAVTNTIRSAKSSQQLLQTVVDTISRMLEIHVGVLLATDAEGEISYCSYQKEAIADADQSRSDPLPNSVLHRMVWETRDVEVIEQVDPKNSNLSEAQRLRHAELQAADIQSAVLIPIIFKQDLIAVLALHHRYQPREWRGDEVQLLVTMADQAALAFSQISTYEKMQALANREVLLNTITQSIRSSLNPQEIFAAITQKLGQALRTDACALSLWDETDEYVQCVGLYTTVEPPADAHQKRRVAPTLKSHGTIAPGSHVAASDPLKDAASDSLKNAVGDPLKDAVDDPLKASLTASADVTAIADRTVKDIGPELKPPTVDDYSEISLPQMAHSQVPIAGNPVLQQLITTQESVVIHDMNCHPELAVQDIPMRAPAKSLLIVPLIVDKQILGSISLRQTQQVRRWRADEVELAKAVAVQAALAVQQARLYQTTRQQAEQLLALDRQKTEFFQNISHEFRTPLTLTIGPLESAVSRQEGLSYDQSVIALRNSRRLLRLVNQLLDLQRLDAGRMQPTFRPCDPVAFITEIVEAFQPYCDRKQLTLVTNLAPCPPLYLDFEKFDKVLYNLLSNAMKFTGAGGRITLELSTLLEAGRDRARITVQDTGIGIREDQLGQLFERFQQADGSTNRSYEGTGLGLALVKELVEIHGGEIDVTSEYGRGTTFEVLIPLGSDHLSPDTVMAAPTRIEGQRAAVELSDIEVLAAEADIDSTFLPEIDEGAAPAADALYDHHHTHILVVDDNPDLRTYLSSILQREGYQVRTAYNGAMGWELAATHKPALILTDLMMPGISGLELIQRIRQDSALKGTPVILLTAKVDDETRLEGVEQGADAYLSKPFNDRELLAEVRNLLALKSNERRVEELNTYLTESVLHRFLPASLVKKAALGELQLDLRPEPRLITIVFSDIIGFTELSNLLQAQRVAELLNEYLAAMTDAIFENGGTVDKFMGDAVLALFGAPEELSPAVQAQKAIAAARQMYQKLDKLNRLWQAQGIGPVKFRCGIHQGTAVVGMFGNDERADYTAIGHSVNVAARLQEAASADCILVSKAVAAHLPHAQIEAFGALNLKGIDEPMMAYGVRVQQHNVETVTQ
ncbi:MAG: response regulator [Cyanobacteria bacterium P01_D01_bin.128]